MLPPHQFDLPLKARLSVTPGPPKRNVKGQICCAGPGCPKTFVPERSTARFCSTRCRVRHHRGTQQIVTRTVYGTNAELLAAAARLYVADGALVADVTYGKGHFWKHTNGRFRVLGSDIMTVKKAALRADCRELPYRDETFDAIVFDPPYVWVSHPRMIFHDRYNGGATFDCFNIDDIMKLYQGGMTEARRVLKPRGRLLVKGMDQAVGSRQRWFSRELPEFAELAIHDHQVVMGATRLR